MTVPMIQTERLKLRAHCLDDFEPLVAMRADPDVVRYIGGKATSCIVSPENRASICVAEKCGYKEFVRTEFKGSPIIQYRR